jgi:hypothetical protein
MIPQVDTFPTYKRLLSVGITDKQAEVFIQFQVLEKSITIKMGGMLVIAVGVLFAMLKVFN